MPYKNKESRRIYYEEHKDEINVKRRKYSSKPDVRNKIRLQDKNWRDGHRAISQ